MSKKSKSKEKQSDRMSRREFVQAAAGVVGAATIVPSSVLGVTGQIPPSERVNIAVIGTGGQGIVNIKALLGESDARIVALCDVNEESDYSRFYYRGTAGLGPALKVVNAGYAKQTKSGSYKGCSTHHDFVEMLDSQKNIDAVLIATPDHVHAIASLAAIKRGKHVYCEKPLTHSVYETRVVTEAARKAGVATQMGNHGHSGEGIRLTVEWIRDGAIGDVREIHAWTGPGRFSWTNRDSRPDETVAVPSTFDWNGWLGPVAQRPYHPAYAPYNWLGW
ncbi:MAG: Gfo/Idh/MocA family oxidoreductase, partial [Planctomycetes bacterium]|nr:Gfo/Idh/MocA family oxidoreductase [Planctomycetota bacterium]